MPLKQFSLLIQRTLQKNTSKYGYINTKGEIVIKPQFDGARSFSEGLAAVYFGKWLEGKYGYVDTSGKLVIEPQFESAISFSGGLARVSPITDKPIDGNWGILICQENLCGFGKIKLVSKTAVYGIINLSRKRPFLRRFQICYRNWNLILNLESQLLIRLGFWTKC